MENDNIKKMIINRKMSLQILWNIKYQRNISKNLKFKGAMPPKPPVNLIRC